MCTGKHTCKKKILDLPWSPIVFNPTKYLLLITNLPAMF